MELHGIQFPHLFGGLKFNIDNVAFKLFGIPIYWYGIIIAVGFALAVLLATRVSKKFGIDQEDIIDLVLFAIPSAIIGARLYYVIFKWSDFSGNPISVLNPRTGGLAVYGGIIGAFIAVYFVAKYKKLSVLKLLDFGVPYLILAQGIGRWGNFVNQEAFGTTTSLPWGMTGSRIGTDPVHPTFLYESLWCILVFIFLIWYRNRKKVEGEVFFLYMILYGLGRAIVEGFRIDSLMIGSVRVSQLLAVVFVVIFSILFYVRRRSTRIKAEKNEEYVPSEYAAVLSRLKEQEEADLEAKKAEADLEAKKAEGLSEASEVKVDNAEIESPDNNEQVPNDNSEKTE